MEANELRIGNLVMSNFKRKNEVVDIKTIDFAEDWFNLFQPIPLTEEWLLKFGFQENNSERYCDMHEEYEECTYYYYDMFKLYYNPKLGCYTDDTFDYQFKLEYVHQLQNLYFALTGTELTLKNN